MDRRGGELGDAEEAALAEEQLAVGEAVLTMVVQVVERPLATLTTVTSWPPGMPLNWHVSNCTDVRRYEARAVAIGSSGVVPMTRAAESGGHHARQRFEVRRPSGTHRIELRAAASAGESACPGSIPTAATFGRDDDGPSPLRFANQIVGRATRVITLASTKRPRSRWSSLRSAPLPVRVPGFAVPNQRA